MKKPASLVLRLHFLTSIFEVLNRDETELYCVENFQKRFFVESRSPRLQGKNHQWKLILKYFHLKKTRQTLFPNVRAAKRQA